MARQSSTASRESRKRRNGTDLRSVTRWNFQGFGGTDCADSWHEDWIRIIDLLRNGAFIAGAVRRWLRLRPRGRSFLECRDNRQWRLRRRRSGGPFERGHDPRWQRQRGNGRHERLKRLRRCQLPRHWGYLRDLLDLRWREFWRRRSRRQRRIGRRKRCQYCGNRGNRRDRRRWLLSKVPAWRFQLHHGGQTAARVFVHGHRDSRRWLPTRLCRADSRALLLPAMSARCLRSFEPTAHPRRPARDRQVPFRQWCFR